MTDLTELSKAIYKQNCEVGWWDDPNRCILTTLQLVSTENAEATEGERKNLMDDKLPHRRMGEVELADELVRLLDIAGRFDLPVMVVDVPFDNTLPIAAQHALMTAMLGIIIECYYFNQIIPCDQLNKLVSYILKTGEHFGYDIMGALHEKVEFNRTRPDHKRENRAKKHGVKF